MVLTPEEEIDEDAEGGKVGVNGELECCNGESDDVCCCWA